MTPNLTFDHHLTTAFSQLQSDLASCDLVAYCDLSTRLVLRHAARGFVPQEQLDRLGDHAARSFATLNAARAALPGTGPAEDPAEDKAPCTILVLEPDGSLLAFARPCPTAEEALLCRAARGTELASLRRSTETAVQHLAVGP